MYLLISYYYVLYNVYCLDWINELDFEDNIIDILKKSIKIDGNKIFYFNNQNELITYLRLMDERDDITNNEYLISVKQKQLFNILKQKQKELKIK